MKDRRKVNRYAIIVTILLFCSVIINIAQTHMVQGLNAAILHVKSELNEALGSGPGRVLGPLSADGIDGSVADLTRSLDDKPTLLYIFTPACSWCKKNLRNINYLAVSLEGSHRVVGLSLSREGLSEYLSSNHHSFPVYIARSGNENVLKRLGGTPRTLVLEPTGKVLENWFGAYDGDVKTRVERYFQLSLPGVSGQIGEPADCQDCQ